MAKIAIILDQLGASEFIFNEFRSKKAIFDSKLVSKWFSRGKKWSKPWLDSGLKFLPGWNLVVKRVIQSLSVRNRIRVASLGSFIEGCLFRIVELEKVVARTQLSL